MATLRLAKQEAFEDIHVSMTDPAIFETKAYEILSSAGQMSQGPSIPVQYV